MPNITDVVYYDTVFCESSSDDNLSLNLQTIHAFKSENCGFDMLMFGFNSNNELIAFFIENKYSFLFDKSAAVKQYKKSSIEIWHDSRWLNEKSIENKHKVLTFDVIAKQFGDVRIGGIYHVFISLQQHLDVKHYSTQLHLNNVIVLSAGSDLKENFEKFQHYYGPSFFELMSSFRDAKAVIDEKISKEN